MVYVFAAFILFYFIAWLAPKRLTGIEIYATSMFAYAYGITTDVVFDLHYDMYGYIAPGFQWLGLLAIALYFPVVSFLFLNFLPSTVGRKIVYMAGWVAFSLTFEWFTVKTDFFYYNGWQLWYSALSYPLIFLVLIVNLFIVRAIIRKLRTF
ncbi:hypothetical protein [Paenibacillus sp.]|uniref:hypothetical protein n=1 Tax=Paenibacillus sp. TaxID=58172 RepID=UPI002D4B0C34|nr:hypothetical protein [Paenibacillus sp.]HZG83610.1 hypothetical protein [Paenibacillus sp.]